ncbi:hypothetical protein BT93_L3446 [Corymbia citriodora subsp. variegata]|uniref:Uncharacterized protein n=1 Tax=Corymbia citriodora subsp. variegata TaxID=360336 RepID=A0A8T0CVK9_CORYI|nr:hypothetical protein BT93_L3446 [Corymbia citriodora subsp. variegata]
MAISSQAIGKCTLIMFALMIFHEIVFIYGRPMKPTIVHNANSLRENYPITSVKVVGGKIDAQQKIAEREVLSRSTLAQRFGLDHSRVVYVGDFYPAMQGNSVRVSQSFPREEDAETKEMDGRDRHVVAASRNDFQPTEPGHSPGVGHSFQYKGAAELNS